MQKPKVVVVIPTYNEAGNIQKTSNALNVVFRALPTYDCHILFVDDNSPDGTRLIVEQLIKHDHHVHILNNKRKGGLGHAYKKGFIYALDKLKADILFEFDADLQHDPAIIPAMLKQLKAGSDLVLGSRYIKGGGIPAHWGLHRKFLSIVGNRFIQLVMLDFHLSDWTTGFRALTADLARMIIPEMSGSGFTGYTWQIGFLVKSLQKGYKVVEVPFVFRDRSHGSSKLGPEYIINTLKYIMKIRFNQLLHSRILKFVMVGGFGALVQFVALYLYRLNITYQLAFFLAIETAIVSNFILSNIWTFADRKLKASAIPGKFVQFNLASAGSIVIQQIIAFIGEHTFGFVDLFRLPLIKILIDTGMLYAVIGILVGMFWNFFAYSHFVWKKK